ncbi:hypothetical protein ACFOPN_18450 [Xanthomonas hyacinthi]|uniref:hypothetical protein n=1 Tax=Xanthomonas hyacinthi TaxID=56455 RepID=UPI001FCB1387|nr:hypothetical protein [Xanthomonas hyacinthi]
MRHRVPSVLRGNPACCALGLLALPFAACVQWHDRQGTPLPDSTERAHDKTFAATVHVADEAAVARFGKKWTETDSRHGPQRVALADYPAFFTERIAADPRAVLHNADLMPPRFDRPLAATWLRSDAAPTDTRRLVPRGQDYAREQNLIWAASELPLGRPFYSCERGVGALVGSAASAMRHR